MRKLKYISYHTWASLLKSGIRILGFAVLMIDIKFGAVLLIIAEVIGIMEEKFRRDFKIPKEMYISAIIGFGYPIRMLSGKRKNGRPLNEFVYYENYVNNLM